MFYLSARHRTKGTTMSKFAVEMKSMHGNDFYAGFGKVHAAGCRDLKDAAPFESEPTQAGIDAGYAKITGYEPPAELSPCAAKLLAPEKTGIETLKELLTFEI